MSSSQSIVGGGTFRVGRRCGEGSFGVVYEGTNITNGQPVALKFEPRKTESPQLRDEYKSYKMLSGMPGFPQVYYFGQEGLHYVLIMDMLGPNLEDLFDLCSRKFSIKTVCMLAKQMITRVQAIHEKSLIYRDIKPDNFLIGLPQTKLANVVHMVDFGMAKAYRDPRTRVHIPYREKKSLSGTARYMSINTHLGREQSRRDDLESLGHVLIYFLRGSLPWQGLKAQTNKQKYEKIGQKKAETQILDLCEGFPQEVAFYLTYARRLGFEETPDYDYMRELFTKILQDSNTPEDGVFDWMLLNAGKGYDVDLYNPQVLQQAHLQACTLSALDPMRSSRRQSHQMQPSISSATSATGTHPAMAQPYDPVHASRRDLRIRTESPTAGALLSAQPPRGSPGRYHPYNVHPRAGSNVAILNASAQGTMRSAGGTPITTEYNPALNVSRNVAPRPTQNGTSAAARAVHDDEQHGRPSGIRRFLCCG